MSWGVPRRPRISNRVDNRPTNREGGDGDIQIKGTGLGAKLFAKWSGRWWDVPLSIDGITRIGATLSDYLRIDRDSVDVYKDKTKIASFGATTTIGDTSTEHISITSSTMQMKDSSTVMMSLADGDISMKGKINVTSVGSQNVMMGAWSATNPDVSGVENNVCLGVEAGRSLSGGTDNIFIGTNSGYASAGTTYNVAIGVDTLKTDDVPIQNVAIGYQSMALGGQMRYNVAIGKESLKAVDGDSYADFNVAVGNRAMFGADGISSNICRRNVAVGADALYAITNGHSNVGVGYEAGNAITTGGYNVCVGYGTDGAATVSEQIAIGNAVVCDTTETMRIGDTAAYVFCNFASDGVTTLSATSDVRIKKDIVNTDIGLGFINALRPVKYTGINKHDYPGELFQGGVNTLKESTTRKEDPTARLDGFIGQEVKQVMDDLGVTFSGWRENNSSRQMLSYSTFVVPLVKAVQELSAKLDTMQTEINNLK